MGFMVRVILGIFLVITTRQWIDCAPSSSQRYARQLIEDDAVPEIPIIDDELGRLNESAKEDFYTNNVINHTLLANNSAQSNIDLDQETKTEIKKQFDNHSENKKAFVYENVSVAPVTIPEVTPEFRPTEKVREESGRSIDIAKYVSSEFHDKNNVYSLSISSDTEKYTNIHNDISFSSTQAYDFDKKQREIETDVKHKLKYIDRKFEQEEKQFSSPPDDSDLAVTKIINSPKDNETTRDLKYTKYRDITSQSIKKRNKINKETDVETGETIDSTLSFNKSHAYDEETPKDYKNKISSLNDNYGAQVPHKATTESTDTKQVDDIIDRAKEKSLLPNRTANQNHLLSNKIENEVLTSDTILNNPKSDFSHYTATTSRITTEVYGEKENVISISKRGSTKYADTITSTIPTTTRGVKENDRRRNGTAEEVVLENQIHPVKVPAPITVATTEISDTTHSMVTTEIDMTTTTEDKVNTTTEDNVETTTEDKVETTADKVEETTEDKVQTTTEDKVQTTTEDKVETTTEDKVATTEVETTTMSTTTESLETTNRESTVGETSTVPTTEASTDMVPTTTKATVELDRVNNARGFNFTSSGFEYQTLEDKLDNKTYPPTETFTSLVVVNTTPSEIGPTTSDYGENIIFKHPETTSARQTSLSDSSAGDIYKEITKKSTDSQSTTQWYSVRTHPTPETTPFIIPLNISMYEVDSAESTTINIEMEEPEENKGGKIAAIVISTIGAICLLLLAGLLIVMRKRHKRFNYGQRCTPVGLDAYSVDNVSVYNSLRRKSAMRASKRSYGNLAFEDPSSVTNPLNFPALAKFANNSDAIAAEFDEVPQVTAQTTELPEGCETKNRYANVIPLPETRVYLTPIEGYINSDYINANYVTGPKSTNRYYIACQAPMQNTVEDFWRMVWEQQSKVILMLTHLYENGGEKCVDYLPPSEVLDCHRLFGDFQITLKNREVKEKYVISILQLKNMVSNSWREVTHLWYLGWPEKGVPSEANSLIAFLIEARSYIKALPAENGKTKNGEPLSNGSPNLEHSPIVVHCSPGTGRTGTVIACDTAIREFELMRQVDIPKTVYRIRRDRASSVQTREQYHFIYNVITLYATKLTGGVLDSL